MFQSKVKLTFIVLICSLVLQVMALQDVRAAETEKQNVLFIMIDDLNDWIGCMKGHPQAYTPNMDKLASQGTLFTNAHCQGPICGPSRNSLMSGLHVHTTGVYQQPGSKLNEDKNFFNTIHLPKGKPGTNL